VKERGGLEKNMRRERQSWTAHATAADKQGLAVVTTITTTAAIPGGTLSLVFDCSELLLVSSGSTEH
jgi:hypothetical protein